MNWDAVFAVAEAWAQSQYMKTFARYFRQGRSGPGPVGHFLMMMLAGYGTFVAQPLLLHFFMPYVKEFDELADNKDAQEWLEAAERVGFAFLELTAWIRSRMPGYPFLDVPHLARNSALRTSEFSLRIPWLDHHLRAGLQFETDPGMQGLFTSDETHNEEELLVACRQLASAVGQSRPFRELAAAREALTESDRESLRESRQRASKLLSDKALDAVEESQVIPRLQYREAILAQACEDPNGPAREYCRCFERADQFVGQTMSVLQNLLAYGGFLKIVNVTEAESDPGDDSTLPNTRVIARDPRAWDVHVGRVVVFDGAVPGEAAIAQSVSHRFNRNEESVVIEGPLIADLERMTLPKWIL